MSDPQHDQGPAPDGPPRHARRRVHSAAAVWRPCSWPRTSATTARWRSRCSIPTEQASGEHDVTARTDIYSLGAVVYEMLAGEPPFTGPTAQAVIAKRFSGEVPSVRKSRPAIPEPVDRAITRALAPVPADRWSTAAEFARALVPAADLAWPRPAAAGLRPRW